MNTLHSVHSGSCKIKTRGSMDIDIDSYNYTLLVISSMNVVIGFSMVFHSTELEFRKPMRIYCSMIKLKGKGS